MALGVANTPGAWTCCTEPQRPLALAPEVAGVAAGAAAAGAALGAAGSLLRSFTCHSSLFKSFQSPSLKLTLKLTRFHDRLPFEGMRAKAFGALAGVGAGFAGVAAGADPSPVSTSMSTEPTFTVSCT